MTTRRVDASTHSSQNGKIATLMYWILIGVIFFSIEFVFCPGKAADSPHHTHLEKQIPEAESSRYFTKPIINLNSFI